MGKFSFSGRKKHAPDASTSSEPTSKVHKILGSTPINVDNGRAWEKDAAFVSAVETEHGRNRGGRGGGGRDPYPIDYDDDDDDEEEGEEDGYDPDDIPTPYQVESDREHGGAYQSPNLRLRQSSSTIKEWHDETHRPAHVSRQSSSSNMTKGPPSKAQELLNMSADGGSMRRRAAPAKLELRDTTHRPRKGTTDSQNIAQTIGQVLRSPSIKSPGFSLGGERKPRKLQKRPTAENLRAQGNAEAFHARAASANRLVQHQTKSAAGLNSLYDHYEQMSLRQLMDLEQPPEEDEEPEAEPETQAPRVQPPSNNQQTAAKRQLLEGTFDMLPPPRGAHLAISVYSDQSSSGDCSGSISSRHTRTSKHTDPSMQGSDLQDKNFLNLSSDSEDDEPSVMDFPSLAPMPPTSRNFVPQSDLTPLERVRRPTYTGPSIHSSKSTRSNKSNQSKGHSQAGSYPHPPSSSGTMSSAPSSIEPMPYIHPMPSSQSPSRASVLSKSSINTTVTWQTKATYASQDPRTSVLTAGPSTSMNKDQFDQRASMSYADTHRASIASSCDQPTPPLSPSTFTPHNRTQSAPSEEASPENRLMAVTREEEMLLAALRQQNQLARESVTSKTAAAAAAGTNMPTRSNSVPQRHGQKPSHGTIAEALFDFGFPSPPRAEKEDALVDVRSLNLHEALGGPGMVAVARENQIFAPAPTRPVAPKGILKNSIPELPQGQSDQIQYDALGLGYDPEPSPDLSEPISTSSAGSREGHFINPLMSNPVRPMVAQRQYPPPDEARDHLGDLPSRPRTRKNPPRDSIRLARGNMSPDQGSIDGSSTHLAVPAVGVPRPDSPVSPDAFPAMPSPRTNNMARLSAFGPPSPGEPGCWDDDG